MSSVNKVVLIGNLGKDPESKTNERGTIARFNLATGESWRDKQTGERRERTEWHTVVIFNEGLAKVAAQYLTKGSKVYVEGKLRTRKWQDQGGNDRYTTEVVLEQFGGTLVMLSSQREAGAEEDDGGNPNSYRDMSDAQYAAHQGGRGHYAAPAGHRERAPIASPKEKAAATGRSFDKTMDDPIPF